MIPGTTGVEIPRCRQVVDQPEVLLRPEEELGDREVRQPQLLGQVVAVGGQVGRTRMPGGMGCHPDRESADGPGQLDQFDGVGQLALGGFGVGGRITAQGHEVFDARLAEVDQDLRQLQPGVGHADQMGHRCQAGGAQHPDHQIVGALAGRPTAPVGDRDERRPQRLQLQQRLDQTGVLGVALRGKELERVRPPGGEQVGDPGHDQSVGPSARGRSTSVFL